MTNELLLTLIILGSALALFLSGRLPADLVALLVVVALGLTGVLTTQEAFSGFSRSAVITIIAIFVLTEALERTGVTEQVGGILSRIGGKSELQLIISVMVAGAFLSFFMNNIAAAAVLLPAATGAAKKAHVRLSKILIPLAFSTILGGAATLFTTSNIVLNSILRDHDIGGFSLVDFLPVGLPIAVFGILYIALVGRRSLPGDSPIERTVAPDATRRSDLIEAYKLDQKLFRARVPDNSFLTGKKLSECTLREDFGVNVVAIERGGKKLLDLSPDTKIRRGDTLVLEGDEDDFRERDVKPFMEYLPDVDWKESDLESQTVEVFEAMLAPRSRLIGRTLRSIHFREKYGVSALAIWHGDKEIFIGIADVPLRFGDALLLQGPREKLAVLRDDPDIILLMGKDDAEMTVHGRGWAALAIFAVTLLLALLLPDLTGAIMLGGALAMVVARIISIEQAYSSIGWKTVFLVAGMLPMGIALTKTNAAGITAVAIVDVFGGHGPMILVAGLFIVSASFTQLVNGAVAATIIGPIAIQIAQQAGVDPRGVIMGVAMGASMAFMTPLSHAVNVLVMSPGGYCFKDYFKIGLPLTALLFVVAMIFLRLFWLS